LSIALFASAHIPVFAHTGKTDSNGGHTDYSTGDYHYHHGYPAHAHYDMNNDGTIDCPYDYDDQTNHSSGSNSSSSGNLTLSKVAYDEGYADGYDKGFDDGYDEGYTKAQKEAQSSAKKIADEHQRALNTLQSEQADDIGAACTLTVFLTLLVAVPIFVSFHNRSTRAAESQLAAASQRIKDEYDRKQEDLLKIWNDEFDRMNKEIKAQKKQLMLGDISSGLDENIVLPPDISLRRSFTPIKGERRTFYPYGDYTVFMTGSSIKYHCKHNCSPSAKPIHFFDLPPDAQPCFRCVAKEMYPQDRPQWYLDIRKKLDEES